MLYCTKLNGTFKTAQEGAMKKKPKIYGYCRISRRGQNIDRQERNILAAYPVALIRKEIYSGRTEDRPEWQRILRSVEAGDVIVFDSVSRMSRNAEEGFKTYQDLFTRGVALVFLKEPMIDTGTYQKALQASVPLTGTAVDLILEGVNRYLLSLAEEQIRLAFLQSEKEVEDMRQRTREGLETAKLNGRPPGRRKGQKVVTEKSVRIQKAILSKSKTFGGAYLDQDLIKILGVNRSTYYKYKKQLRSAWETTKGPGEDTDQPRDLSQKGER